MDGRYDIKILERNLKNLNNKEDTMTMAALKHKNNGNSLKKLFKNDSKLDYKLNER